MRQSLAMVVGVFASSLLLASPVLAGSKCPADSVVVGALCVDKYEASVWETTNAATIKKIRKGKIKDANKLARVATQHGVGIDDYGAGCPDSGSGCTNFYAVSIPGVKPSTFINWFQAAAACRNAGKRLLTNAEWQAAALGTPDGAPCIIGGSDAGVTGTTGCISDVGAFDMVGNVWEWVADWVPRSTGCTGSWGTFSDDFQCFVGAETTGQPGVLLRGGGFDAGGTGAGVFAVFGADELFHDIHPHGFRCGR